MEAVSTISTFFAMCAHPLLSGYFVAARRRRLLNWLIAFSEAAASASVPAMSGSVVFVTVFFLLPPATSVAASSMETAWPDSILWMIGSFASRTFWSLGSKLWVAASLTSSASALAASAAAAFSV